VHGAASPADFNMEHGATASPPDRPWTTSCFAASDVAGITTTINPLTACLLSDMLQAALGVAASGGGGSDEKLTNVLDLSDYTNQRSKIKEGATEHGKRTI
jgi:hypothetical protein